MDHLGVRLLLVVLELAGIALFTHIVVDVLAARGARRYRKLWGCSKTMSPAWFAVYFGSLGLSLTAVAALLLFYRGYAIPWWVAIPGVSSLGLLIGWAGMVIKSNFARRDIR